MKSLNNKLYALLGFAAKSGSLCYGFNDSKRALSRSKAKGIFFANDISAKSRKEIMFQSEKFGVSAYELEGISMEKLSSCIGRRCAVVAVTDNSFVQPIISHLTSDV